MNKNSKIYVAGHSGLVGTAITEALKRKGYTNIIGRIFEELDLRRQADTEAFFAAAPLRSFYLSGNTPQEHA